MWKEGCAPIQNNKIYNIIFPQCHNAVAKQKLTFNSVGRHFFISDFCSFNLITFQMFFSCSLVQFYLGFQSKANFIFISILYFHEIPNRKK